MPASLFLDFVKYSLKLQVGRRMVLDQIHRLMKLEVVVVVLTSHDLFIALFKQFTHSTRIAERTPYDLLTWQDGDMLPSP